MEDARKYFLTVLQAEDVKIDDKTDDTLKMLHDCQVPDDCPWWDVSPEKDPSRRSYLPSAGHIPIAPLQEIRAHQKNIEAGNINICHKIHFRVVFAELGTPIFDLKLLGDVLETLEHALKGLPSLTFPILLPLH